MSALRKYSLLWTMALALATASTLTAQQAAKKFTTAAYGDIHYLEHLPSNYNTSGKQYPLLIFLHGGGEQGPADGTLLNKVKRFGPPKYIEEGDNMTFTVNGQAYSFIVISPQLQYGVGSWSNEYIDAVVQSTLDRYRVDRSRTYLTGLSLGGGGTWRYGAQQADFFAAIAPLAGAQSPNTQIARSIADASLPVWIFHGQNDGRYSSSQATQWANLLNNQGANPAPKLTIYPGLGHESKVWDNAYRTDRQVHNPNLYEWFLQYQRGSTPPPTNQPPVARAGADVSVSLPTNQVQLSGSTSSDPDGSIAAYAWTKTGGPSGSTLSGQTTATLTVSNLTAGTYTFQLQVTDNQGASATDQVQVTVAPPASVVTVDAGADRSVRVGTSLTLSPGSVQGPYPFRQYQWQKLSGPSVTLTKANTANVELTNLSVGTYVFRFTATDSEGNSGSDELTLTVTGSSARTASASLDRPSSADTPKEVTTLSGYSDPTGRSMAAQASSGDCSTAAGSSVDITQVAGRLYGPNPALHGTIPTETSALRVAYPKGHPKRTDNLTDDQYLQNKIAVLSGATPTLYFVAGKYRLKASLRLKDNMKIIGQQGAVLSGAQPVNGNWSSLGSDVYARRTSIARSSFFDDYKCQGGGTTCRRPNDLFLDGRWLKEVEDRNAVRDTPGSWMFDEGSNASSDDNQLIVHLPTGVTADVLNSQMEFSQTIRAFYSNFDQPGSTSTLQKISVENLTFEMFTYEGFSTGSDWKVLNCWFLNNHISGLGVGNNTYVARCRMEYNGSTGTGGGPDNAVIENNELAFNNQAGYSPGWHAGGMKMGRATNTTVSGNFVHDNLGTGLWVDSFCDFITLSGNYVRDHPLNGIHYEISQNGTITNNYLERSGNNGIFIVSSPNVLVEKNTVRYTMNGIIALQDDRGYEGSCVGSNIDPDNVCRKQIRNITVRKNVIVLDNVNAVATGVRILPYNYSGWQTASFRPERFYQDDRYNFNFSENKYQYVTKSGTPLEDETAFNWEWKNSGSVYNSSKKGTQIISWTEWQALGLDEGSCLDVPKATSLWQEAECGRVGSEWLTKSDDAASNGQYVMYPLEEASTGTPPGDPANHVTFSVSVPQSDSYYLLARIRAPDNARNSFWVKVDNRSWIKWYEGITVGNSFAWNLAPGGTFPLSAGPHTVTFAYREGGTQLDKLVLSTSASVPSELGGTAPACPPASVVTAFAGADKTVTAGRNLTLSGFGQGPNPFRGYLWQKLSGPSVTLTDANTANVVLTNLQVGTYRFRFTATDSEGNSGFDELTLTVTGSSARTANRSVRATTEPLADASAPPLAYPNPTDRSLTVGFARPLSTSGVVQLTDLTGRVVYQTTVVARQQRIEIPTGALPEGVYLLRWSAARTLHVSKVFVRH